MQNAKVLQIMWEVCQKFCYF